jgi:hypothetical protein
MLETLTINIDAVHTTPSSNGEQGKVSRSLMAGLKFRGDGSTSYDRVRSMQAQLSAFSAAPNFLHPACWTSHTCLTAVDITSPIPALRQGSIFRAIDMRALRIPSLEELDLEVCGLICGLPVLPSSLELCNHLSDFPRLTFLSVGSTASIHTSMHTFWESIGALAQLRKLHIWLQCGPKGAATFTIPTSWTALSRLTDLQLLHATWYSNPAGLVHLEGLQNLWMNYATQQLPQILTSCAQLPSLTSLMLYGIDGESMHAATQEVGQLLAGPSNSGSPLQVLQLLEFQRMTGAQLRLFPGLTKLNVWGDYSKFPNSHLTPLADLSLLQHLELHRIKITQELCW